MKPVLFNNFLKLCKLAFNNSVEIRNIVQTKIAYNARKYEILAVISIGIFSTILSIVNFGLSSQSNSNASHDQILRARFSSPTPSKKIIILDVDEKTLATLAPQHGRWPWHRDVFADAIQKLDEYKVKGIVFNIIISDPDKGYEDNDSALEYAAQTVKPIVFPLVRLNPKNDSSSQLKIKNIPGSKIETFADQNQTIAAIIPFIPSMHDRLGVANQKTSDDGIVRSYPYRWKENNWSLPSLVSATVKVAKIETTEIPDEIILNWRNKKGNYQRISFSDLLLTKKSKLQETLNNSIVVIGVSAPGLGMTKPTSVNPTQDDSEIIATALDDAINSSYLRVLPNWLILILTVIFIWLMVTFFILKITSNELNVLFGLLQLSLGAITLLTVSYSYYLIDLTEPMSFLLAIFSTIKIVDAYGSRWLRASPGYRKSNPEIVDGNIYVVGYSKKNVNPFTSKKWQKKLETLLGFNHVIHIESIFNSGNFFEIPFDGYECLILLVQNDQVKEIDGLFETHHDKDMVITKSILEEPWNPHDSNFATSVAPKMLQNCISLVNRR